MENIRSFKKIKKIIGVFGYGSQGRAHALNLRDSGYKVLVANINDDYSKLAKKDKFKVHTFEYVSKNAEIVFLLLPDFLHKHIYDNYLKKNLKTSSTIFVAHGYSLYFKEISIKKKFNYFLLAPRLPGPPIRKLFLQKKKIPAFYSSISVINKKYNKILFKIAKDLRFDLSKKFKTNYIEETEIDLFIEQYVIPRIIFVFEESFNFLIKNGFSNKIAIMDLYGSGEIADLIFRASKIGIHQIWQQEASPTCRVGYMQSLNTMKKKKKGEIDFMKHVLKNIRNGKFDKTLKREFKKKLENLKKFDKFNNNSLFYKSLKNLN